MARLNKRTKRTAVIVALLILIAMLLRVMWRFLPPNNLRGIIYIGLFAAWGVSVRRRILQAQVRRYLTAISVLTVFWVVVRSVKYMLFSDTHLGRYCWYLYYLPMLFIPLLVLLVALSLGKPESFRLPKRASGLLLISAALFALVLTNDFHQLAFGFPKGLLYYDNNDYSHELVYYLSMGWMAICAVSALAVMIMKCHIPGKKKRIYLPYIPLLALILYAVLYLTAWDLIKLLAGDMTVVSCLLIAATLESCIQCGLIQSNTHYDELFRRSSVRAIITDNDYNVVLSSEDTEPLSKELMRQAVAAPVLLDGNIRISGAPIKGGHVLWSDDVSELTGFLEELAEKQEDLREEYSILRENYKTETRIRQLTEKNRLYDKMHRQTARQIALLDNLLKQFEAEKDEAARKSLLQKMAVVGVYLKRRSNLIFLSEQSQTLHINELSLCFEETMDSLKLSGIDCGRYIAVEHELPASAATAFYDFFETVIEASYDSLRSVLIRVYENADCTAMSLDVSCGADLSGLNGGAVSVSYYRDEGYSLSLHIPKGGAEP